MLFYLCEQNISSPFTKHKWCLNMVLYPDFIPTALKMSANRPGTCSVPGRLEFGPLHPKWFTEHLREQFLRIGVCHLPQKFPAKMKFKGQFIGEGDVQLSVDFPIFFEIELNPHNECF